MDYRGRYGYESRADMGMSLRHMNMSINRELDVHYRGCCGYESRADTGIDMNMDIGLDIGLDVDR